MQYQDQMYHRVLLGVLGVLVVIIVAATYGAYEQLAVHARLTSRDTEVNARLLQQICINTAPTVSERVGCSLNAKGFEK